MIELVFAIVIMGFVMMSAPMLISQATQSSIILMQQEAIPAAGTQMVLVLTRHWDERNTGLNSPVLTTLTTEEALIGDLNRGRRAGTPPLSKRSIIGDIDQEINASSLGSDINETSEAHRDDIDDFNGVINYISGSSSTDDYKDSSLKLQTTVNYASDAPTSSSGYNSQTLTLSDPFTTSSTSGTSNIKHIAVRISSEQNGTLDTNIVLHAFSCNIGTFTIDRRDF